MSEQGKDELRRELRKVASDMARTDALLEKRGKFVAEARGSQMTWREIAGLLGMTEHGLIKSQRAWEKRQSEKAEAK